MNLELGCSFIVHRVWYSLGSPGVHTRDQWPFNLKLPQGSLWKSAQHTPQIEPRSGKRVNFCVWINFSQMCIYFTFWLHSYLTARVCWHLPTLNVITDREFCFYSFEKRRNTKWRFFYLLSTMLWTTLLVKRRLIIGLCLENECFVVCDKYIVWSKTLRTWRCHS